MNELRTALLVNALQLVEHLPEEYRAGYEEAICDEELKTAFDYLAHLPAMYSRISELLLFCPAEVEVLEGFVLDDTVYGIVNATPDEYYLGGAAAEIVRWRHGEETGKDAGTDETDWDAFDRALGCASWTDGWEDDDYEDEWDEDEWEEDEEWY